MAQQAQVLYCVAFDEATHECTQQAWMPAPQLLPPLEPAAVGQLLTATAVALAVAWGWKHLGRTTRY